ncbi:hypothetical protein NIES4075_27220 [Tolypothrix sp. NIES-4075]|nr:hypothetical protein NIES4075_27220 [Tolypothrix sp. NIES-4075]
MNYRYSGYILRKSCICLNFRLRQCDRSPPTFFYKIKMGIGNKYVFLFLIAYNSIEAFFALLTAPVAFLGVVETFQWNVSTRSLKSELHFMQSYADCINGIFASLLATFFTLSSGVKSNKHYILTSEFFFIGAFMPFIKYKVI